MRVTMIGGGYVGLVSGACFAQFGMEVTIVEADQRKLSALQAGSIPIFEPGLDTLVAENVAAKRLSFTDDLDQALDGAEVVFIAVGTPTRRGDGHADLTYVYQAADQVARRLKGYAVIVTKSTVPVGTGRKVAEVVRAARPDLDFDVASNPEFLREGSAIGDFMRPDRVVIGVESERAEAVLSTLYRPLFLIETPIVVTSIETAELIKYAANSFLAMKVTFINEVADLCERVGADVHDVARGMGLDGRIGRNCETPSFLAASWIFRHNIMELSTSIKGWGLERLLATGYDYVMYLDPDCWVLEDPALLISEMSEHCSVAVVPHTTRPADSDEEIRIIETSSLRHGIYNLGSDIPAPAISRMSTHWQLELPVEWLRLTQTSRQVTTRTRLSVRQGICPFISSHISQVRR